MGCSLGPRRAKMARIYNGVLRIIHKQTHRDAFWHCGMIPSTPVLRCIHSCLGHVQLEGCRLDMFDRGWGERSPSIGGWSVDSNSGFSQQELETGSLLASHPSEIIYTVLISW